MTYDPDELKRELDRIQKELNIQAGNTSNTLPTVLASASLLIAVVALVITFTRPVVSPSATTEAPQATDAVVLQVTLEGDTTATVSGESTPEATRDATVSVEATTAGEPIGGDEPTTIVELPAVLENVPAFTHSSNANDTLEITFEAPAIEGRDVTYHWNFGDGETADSGSEVTVPHKYASTGDYDVTLSIREGGFVIGQTSNTISVGAESLPPLTAKIIVNDTPEENSPFMLESPVAINVTFTANSEPAVSDENELTYEWQIDGEVVLERNQKDLSHKFDPGREYVVSVTISDPQTGRVSDPASVRIVITESLSADFTFEPPTYLSLEVQFQSTITGIPDSIEWDFDNDGMADSEEENPKYLFPDYGRYRVRLTVKKNGADPKHAERDVVIIPPVAPSLRVAVTTTASAGGYNRIDGQLCPVGDAQPEAGTAVPCDDIFAVRHDFIAHPTLQVVYILTSGTGQPIVGLPFDVQLTMGANVQASLSSALDAPLVSPLRTNADGKIELQITFPPLPETNTAFTAETPLLGEAFLTFTSTSTALSGADLNRWLRIQPIVSEDHAVMKEGTHKSLALADLEINLYPPPPNQSFGIEDAVVYYRGAATHHKGTYHNNGRVYIWLAELAVQHAETPDTAEAGLKIGDVITVINNQDVSNTYYCISLACMPERHLVQNTPELTLTWESAKYPTLTGSIIGRYETESGYAYLLVEYDGDYNDPPVP